MKVMDKRWGFTLIEILVTVAIMGILAGIGYGSYINSLKKGRDGQRKSDLGQVQKALEAYVSDYQVYPSCSSSGQIVACGVDGGDACVWGESFSRNVGGVGTDSKIYMGSLPSDPSSGVNYIYVSDGSEYQLLSVLENAQDADYDDSYTVSCGSESCKYKVVSANGDVSTKMLPADHCSL